MNINEFKWQQRLPDILVVLWLLFLGISIWQHALHSGQPPLYDPLSYMWKAKNFWEAIGLGKPFNPINLEPAIRPPGSVLMSYPFGFSDDFIGFHFRSIFLPILCVVVAVYIVTGISRSLAEAVWAAAIAVLFSTLPMFYHLDWADDTYGPIRWGCVDNFQAGVAAIAMAAAIRSLMTKSLAWLMLAISLAVFTLLIKPSGVMVMALMALAWLIIVAFQWRLVSRQQPPDRLLSAYALKGAVGFFIIYAFAISICIMSQYFSAENFAFAKKVLVVMVDVGRVSFQDILLLFHQSSGEALPLWIMGVVSLFPYADVRGKKPISQMRSTALACLVISLVIWGLGAWYWLVVQAGGTQIRYFYPFMLMGSVCVIPAALVLWRHTHRLVRVLFLALCFIPALNIAGLLVAGDSPSIYWQKLTGVSVSVGNYKEPAHQAYAFLDEVRKTGKNPTIYSFDNGISAVTFENALMYNQMFKPDQPVFRLLLPLDWVNGFAVRINEILASDYILVKKSGSEEADTIKKENSFDTFQAETRAFEAWLSTLHEESGIKIISDGKVLSLLRIDDTAALNHAIEKFISAHTWRPEFLEANKPLWWNSEAVSAYTNKLAAEEIEFGGIFKLQALLITSVANRIKIEVWWEEIRHEDANSQRVLFLHLVDSSGNILQGKHIALSPYAPLDAKRRWRHDEASFDLPTSDESVKALAFGVYHVVNSQTLVPDKGQTDWGGKRVLIPLTPLLHPSVDTTTLMRR
jgi:hypothetical protein